MTTADWHSYYEKILQLKYETGFVKCASQQAIINC